MLWIGQKVNVIQLTFHCILRIRRGKEKKYSSCVSTLADTQLEFFFSLPRLKITMLLYENFILLRQQFTLYM